MQFLARAPDRLCAGGQGPACISERPLNPEVAMLGMVAIRWKGVSLPIANVKMHTSQRRPPAPREARPSAP